MPPLFDYLPKHLHDTILAECSPTERVSVLSKVSKASRDAVESYNRRAFRIEKVLSRYFKQSEEHQEITEFRTLQYITGLLISGSSAYQFFDCIDYERSDLDLYAALDQISVVVKFLVGIGYVYEPSQRQDADLDVALRKAVDGDDREPAPWDPYKGKGIAGVFTFSRDGKKIEVVACHLCPMDVILGFHSTCVLNVISHSHAYSLYPRTTFHNRSSIVLPRLLSQHAHIEQAYKAALAKYKSRGFSFSVGLDLLAREHRRERCVGDSACWIIPLSPIPGLDPHLMTLESDPIRANSWSQSYDRSGSLSLEYNNRTAPTSEKFFTCSPYMYIPTLPRMKSLASRVRAQHDGMASEFHIVNEYARLLHEALEQKFRADQTSTPGVDSASMQQNN